MVAVVLLLMASTATDATAAASDANSMHVCGKCVGRTAIETLSIAFASPALFHSFTL